MLFFPKRENPKSYTTHRLVSHTRTEDTIGLNAVAIVFLRLFVKLLYVREILLGKSRSNLKIQKIDRALWNDRQKQLIISLILSR